MTTNNNKTSALTWITTILGQVPIFLGLIKKKERIPGSWECDPKDKRRPQRTECKACGAITNQGEWADKWPQQCLRKTTNDAGDIIPMS